MQKWRKRKKGLKKIGLQPHCVRLFNPAVVWVTWHTSSDIHTATVMGQHIKTFNTFSLKRSSVVMTCQSTSLETRQMCQSSANHRDWALQEFEWKRTNRLVGGIRCFQNPPTIVIVIRPLSCPFSEERSSNELSFEPCHFVTQSMV